MSEHLQKSYSIDIQQKLYEHESPHGNLAVYQTSPFGLMLTLNEQIIISEQDGFFYYEMMAHPALFTHHHPEHVAIVGNCFGILEEVLKHASIKQVTCITDDTQLDEAISQYFSQLYKAKQDKRVQYHIAEPASWLKQCEAEVFDIIIQGQYSENFLQENYKSYHHALRRDGILVQPCQSSLLQLKTFKPIFQNIQHAGFTDWQTLQFPQPSYPSGSRTAMLVTKHPTFKRIRERDVYNRTFATRYYNYDIHKAALALPEFMKEEA